IRLCREKSGTYDVSEFTDKKGLELKNHIRTVEITYENGKLRFLGDSFMPKQVRIMSSFILTNSLEPLPGKYLILEKIYLKDELNNMLIHSNKIDNSLLNEIKEFSSFNFSEVKTEKIGDEITIFYIPKEIKSEFIGKNGNNIKKLKKVIGNILVREI
nr:pseudouridylate synthase [Fusobacteriaceae bacterium]